MIKLLIMSDSHGLSQEIIRIRERHHVSHYIHCGDSELPDDAQELVGFIKVAGNCDILSNLPNEEILEVQGSRILITHGHLYDVKNNYNKLKYRAQEVHADIICFGHSHHVCAETVDNKLYINPGSIHSPRGYSKKSYVIMEIDDLLAVTVTFYTSDGQLINDLTYKTNLVLSK